MGLGVQSGCLKGKRELKKNELAGPKPKETKVETFRIDDLTRNPKAEKLGFEPVSEEEPHVNLLGRPRHRCKEKHEEAQGLNPRPKP